MTPKTGKELERYFEDTFLKGTCFASLKELREDKTLIQINAPRALIAVELMGKWSGFNAGIKKSENQIATLKAEVIEMGERWEESHSENVKLKADCDKLLLKTDKYKAYQKAYYLSKKEGGN